MSKFYKENLDRWINENRVRVGDTVRIVRLVTNGERDLVKSVKADWLCPMDDAVGKIGQVIETLPNGVRLSVPGIAGNFVYPYFILEKIDPEQQKKIDPEQQKKIDPEQQKKIDPEQQTSAHKEWKVSYGLKARTGDPVLVRDYDCQAWRYSFLSHKDSEDLRGMPFSTTSGWFKYCVPYAGNEHLVGTGDAWNDPAAEAERRDFRFGARVQVRIGYLTWEGVMLDYDEQDDSYEIARRDSENKETRRIWVGANEFTYID